MASATASTSASTIASSMASTTASASASATASSIVGLLGGVDLGLLVAGIGPAGVAGVVGIGHGWAHTLNSFSTSRLKT